MTFNACNLRTEEYVTLVTKKIAANVVLYGCNVVTHLQPLYFPSDKPTSYEWNSENELLTLYVSLQIGVIKETCTV